MEKNDTKDIDEKTETEKTEKEIIEEKTINKIKLGDIIEIIAPKNQELNENKYFIEYIDNEVVEMINISTLSKTKLNIEKNHYLSDQSITQIYLHSRSEEEGYAKQNGFLLHKWISIQIGGQVPTTVVGEITNLEEDMIEIKTYPAPRMFIYIDFEYKGIPKNIPFKSFEIIDKPNDENLDKVEEGDDYCEVNCQEKASVEYSESGEMIINIPENAVADETFKKEIKRIKEESDLIFGEELQEVGQRVELSEKEKTYTIEAQTNDLMDELLSTIPNHKRTKKITDNIHLLIERFKQLRSIFSKFDENNNIIGSTYKGPNYKPLIDKLHNLNTSLKWIVPVVAQKRRLFNNDKNIGIYTEDVINADLKEDITYHQTQNNIYKTSNDNANNRYSKLYKSLDSVMNPFVSMSSTDYEDYKKKEMNAAIRISGNDISVNEANSYFICENKAVVSEIDAIVDTLGDFKSTVEKEEIDEDGLKTKYVVQRYNLGLKKNASKISKSGRVVYFRDNLTNDDTMTLKSLIFLPETLIKYSQIDLPTSSILKKAELSKNIVMLNNIFNKKTQLNTSIIDNIDEELFTYDDDDKRFINKNITNYILDDDLHNEPNKFEKFLNVIIPEKRTIIKQMREFITNKMSVYGFLKELEPFYIYSDNLSYGDLMEIRYSIKQEIIKYYDNLDENKRLFKSIRSDRSKDHIEMNQIEKLMFENRNYIELFRDGYKMEKDDFRKITSSELLLRTLYNDGNNLLSDIITSMTISHLSTPEDLLKIFEPAKLDDITSLEKAVPNDCTRRYLAKKYTNMKDLQDDQYKDEVYFDKEFDETPYDIIKKYENEQKTMDEKTFKEFLIENLMSKHGVEVDLVEDFANTLIVGKRQIRDGEYAILQIRPKLPPEIEKDSLTEKEKKKIEIEEETREKVGYYYRLKNKWIYDQNIDPEVFIDTNTLFCNIKSDCFKNENHLLATCEPDKYTKKRLDQLSKSRMVKEFDNRVNISIEELKKKIKDQISRDFKKIIRINITRENDKHRYNNYSYELGKTLIENDVIVSKYAETRDLILAQNDFVKKQSDILKFIELFCREPLQSVGIVENQYWYYCKETNTPLLPMFYGTLANAFMLNDYERVLNELSCEIGTISEDGDNIVDKNSGYLLRRIDFSFEEGYTKEGFKLKSHDIMENELKNESDNKAPLFENQLDEKIYNILHAICRNIGLETELIKNFVIRITNELIKINILNEDSYNIAIQAKEKATGKRQISYEIYMNRIIFWNIASSILVAIQTNTESFNINKTFSNCVRSFKGYPLSGIEDTTGIQYIACIMKAMKSSEVPWNSIEKIKITEYENKIKETIEKYLYIRTDIIKLYDVKRHYLVLHPEEDIPEYHNIKNWTSFSPPVVPFKVGSIRAITKDFDKEFLEQLKQGHREQQKNFNVIKNKSKLYGYGLIEIINNIVKKKDPLLKTASRNPFLENACCNDSNLKVIDYFKNENDNIKQIISISNNLSEMIDQVNNYGKSKTIYHIDDTSIRHPKIVESFSEENIYNTIIKYCNLNNEKIPIPQDFIHIFSEKTYDYPINSSLLDQIEYLKKNNKHFKEEDLNGLMKIVNSKNIINIEHDISYDEKSAVFDILKKFDNIESDIIDSKFREHLTKLLTSYDPNKMMTESKDLDNFKDFLSLANEKMYYGIVEFFDEYGNLTDREYDKLQDFLLSVTETKLEDKDAIYNVIHFIKHSIYNMTKFYPSMIINTNGKSYEKVCDHWDISKMHRFDLKNKMSEYWKFMEMPSINKSIIKNILSEVKKNLNDLYILMDNLPIHTYLSKNGEDFFSLFDKKCIYLIYTYFWYSTIYEYIVYSNDDEHITSNLQEIRSQRTELVEESNDESQQTFGLGDRELAEVDIILGNKESFKKDVAQVLLLFLDVYNKDSFVLQSYNEISEKVRRFQTQEKEELTGGIGDLLDDERKLEKLFMKYKMGKYNIGLQKALIQYDKNHYDQERENIIVQNVQIEAEDIYNDFISGDENVEVDHLGEDFMDGDPEGEYREDEDEFGEI